MTGVGPVEPGDGTYSAPDALASRPRSLRGRWVAATPAQRLAIVACCVAAVATGSGFLYVTRPAPPPPPPVPWPAQSVLMTYRGATATGSDGGLGFTVTLTNSSTAPVTVERISQTSKALWVTTRPAAPFTVRTGKPRNVLVVIHVADCRKVARNAGLPFLDTQLRNVRATQEQSYILGDRYARDLSKALNATCPPNVHSAARTPTRLPEKPVLTMWTL